MHSELETVIKYFLDLDFNDTALILAQYAYCTNNNDYVTYLLLQAFYKKEQIHKMNMLMLENKRMYEYKEINLLCLKAGISRVNQFNPNKLVSIYSKFTQSNLQENQFNLNYESICNYYQGINELEQIRADKLKDAFTLDKNNIEALFNLFKNSQITYVEFTQMIQKVPHNALRNVFVDIFINNFAINNFFTDVYMQIFRNNFTTEVNYVSNDKNINNLVNESEKDNFINELFKCAAMEASEYRSNSISNGKPYTENTSEYVAFIFGLYYVNKKNYREAKKCFAKSNAINEHFGLGWLYSGIACSLLREIESSTKSLDKAHLICDNALTAFYLAREYELIDHRQNRVNFYYKESVDKNDFFRDYYGFYLLRCNEHKKAGDYIKDDLLLVMSCIFSKNYSRAKRLIEKNSFIKNETQNNKLSAYYWLVYGYIQHLLYDYDTAILSYTKCKNIQNISICDALLEKAYAGRMSDEPDKNICAHNNCILEAMPYTNKPKNVFL